MGQSKSIVKNPNPVIRAGNKKIEHLKDIGAIQRSGVVDPLIHSHTYLAKYINSLSNPRSFILNSIFEPNTDEKEARLFENLKYIFSRKSFYISNNVILSILETPECNLWWLWDLKTLLLLRNNKYLEFDNVDVENLIDIVKSSPCKTAINVISRTTRLQNNLWFINMISWSAHHFRIIKTLVKREMIKGMDIKQCLLSMIRSHDKRILYDIRSFILIASSFGINIHFYIKNNDTYEEYRHPFICVGDNTIITGVDRLTYLRLLNRNRKKRICMKAKIPIKKAIDAILQKLTSKNLTKLIGYFP